MRALMRSHCITPIIDRLDSAFKIACQYPIECFFWFGAPRLLLGRGYAKAAYIDGDVYCNGSITEVLRETEAIAGVDGGRIHGILGQDLSKLRKIFGDVSDGARIQTGVLLMNLQALQDFDIETRARQLYRNALNAGAPRKGDDSLFALLMGSCSHLAASYLPREFNYMEDKTSAPGSQEWICRNDHLIEQAKFCHFTKQAPKPWLTDHEHPCYTTYWFARKWQCLAIDSLSKTQLQEHFPGLSGRLTDRHVMFYWWPSENVGDLVTPYLLSNRGVPERYQAQISEDEIDQLEGASCDFDNVPVGVTSNSKQARYIVSTGSVVRLCGPHALVYGSGVRSKDQPTRNAIIRFVRGPLTRAQFISNGAPCPPVYGDPGLLMPRFYSPRVNKTDRIAVVPHFTEYTEVAEKYSGKGHVVVVNMGSGQLEDCIDTLASCKASVSSSLHGLVFSHAYGIPTRHVLFSDKIFGDGTKFVDYYSSIRIPHDPVDYRRSSAVCYEELLLIANELLADFDDTRLWDEFFLDSGGLKVSTFYPY